MNFLAAPRSPSRRPGFRRSRARVRLAPANWLADCRFAAPFGLTPSGSRRLRFMFAAQATPPGAAASTEALADLHRAAWARPGAWIERSPSSAAIQRRVDASRGAAAASPLAQPKHRCERGGAGDGPPARAVECMDAESARHPRGNKMLREVALATCAVGDNDAALREALSAGRGFDGTRGAR